MEMLIFASRVIRSRMRCDRSSWNRAEGCWVLVSCCSAEELLPVGLGLQEAVVTAYHLGLQGSPSVQVWFPRLPKLLRELPISLLP